MKTSTVVRSLVPSLVVLALAAMVPVACAQTITSNLPPHVAIVLPVNGAVFPAGANIPLVAEAMDRDGFVARVEFCAGTNSLGDAVRRIASNTTNLFGLIWSNAPAGKHKLLAKAVDNLGARSVSLPVEIMVGDDPPPPPQTVVTIRASEAYATEPCNTADGIDPGRFTIVRCGDTNIDLTVFYRIGGTASNGVDYAELPQSVVIAKGERSADLVVKPLGDALIENVESVCIRLEPPACVSIWPPPPECYLVGQPAEAAVFIRDCPVVTNRLPLVRIVKPYSGALFKAPATIGIVTDTVDMDGYVWRVEFYEGANKIGEESKMFLVAPTNGTHIPYAMVWSNVPPGCYTLTAQATDDRGLVAVSAPVQIAVVVNPPPPTNRPPVITIAAVDPVAIEGTNCWGWPNLTNRWPIGTATFCTNSIWWFTNCGPKNATFLVRRAGDTNSELPVKYAVGGTATNGVDFEFLSGLVTIPAGERKAPILVVPRGDRRLERIETVILKLLPPPAEPDTPPEYLVGYPNRAAAIIVDSFWPRPITAALADRCFHLGADAIDGAWYRIEYSDDLLNWTPVWTSQVVQGTIHFVDPEAQDSPTRFYRAVPEAEPPPE
jgi:hypothetical protein